MWSQQAGTDQTEADHTKLVQEKQHTASPAASRQLRGARMSLTIQSKLPFKRRQQLSRQSHSSVQEAVSAPGLRLRGLTEMYGYT